MRRSVVKIVTLMVVALFCTEITAQNKVQVAGTDVFGKPNGIEELVKNPEIVVIGNGYADLFQWETGLATEGVRNSCDRNLRQFFLGQIISWNIGQRVYGLQPEWCLVYAGLPDVAQNTPVKEIAEACRHMCREFLAHGVTPVILAHLPVSCNGYLNSQISLLNEAYREVAREYAVPFFDPGYGLTDHGELSACYTEDGVVPNKEGEKLFLENVSAFMKDLIAARCGDSLSDWAREVMAESAIHILAERAPQKTAIAMLGDSITDGGGDWNSKLGCDDILNAGLSGYTTAQVLWHMGNSVIGRKPEKCFILIGINDLFHHVPLEVISNNQKRIIERLAAAGIEPLVQSTLYVRDNPAMNRDVYELNCALKAFCDKHGFRFIDLNAILAPHGAMTPEYTSDGVHLNDEGYRLWVAAIKPYLSK